MRKLKALTITLCAFLVSSCSVNTENNAFSIINKQLESKLNETLQDVYKVSENFSIPEMQIDGATNVTGFLIFPSGKARTGSNIKLSEPGNYTLKYTYYLNGEASYYTQSTVNIFFLTL